MKKLLFVLALIIVLTSITGCQDADPDDTTVPEITEEHADPIKDYDYEQLISVNDTETEGFARDGRGALERLLFRKSEG